MFQKLVFYLLGGGVGWGHASFGTAGAVLIGRLGRIRFGSILAVRIPAAVLNEF